MPGTWIQTGDKWQFKLQKGENVKNSWIKNADKWNHFDNKGNAQTGWVLDQGKWYHCDSKSCVMDTGLYNDPSDGQTYYLDADGSMATGWVQIAGKWYYLNPTPVAATYVYDETTQTWSWNGKAALPYGAVLKNTITPDGYHVDENGARVD